MRSPGSAATHAFAPGVPRAAYTWLAQELLALQCIFPVGTTLSLRLNILLVDCDMFAVNIQLKTVVSLQWGDINQAYGQ